MPSCPLPMLTTCFLFSLSFHHHLTSSLIIILSPVRMMSVPMVIELHVISCIITNIPGHSHGLNSFVSPLLLLCHLSLIPYHYKVQQWPTVLLLDWWGHCHPLLKDQLQQFIDIPLGSLFLNSLPLLAQIFCPHHHGLNLSWRQQCSLLLSMA